MRKKRKKKEKSEKRREEKRKREKERARAVRFQTKEWTYNSSDHVNISALDVILVGLIDFTIIVFPRCNCHLNNNCAFVLPYLSSNILIPLCFNKSGGRTSVCFPKKK